MVQCAKLNRELPGMSFMPIKGELGQRIYDSISEEAWKLWIRQSTMIINEYRLNPADPQAQAILREQMERFLFGEGAEPPQGYTPVH
jgi:Fe-S cluster biosynthesis and repair protein YggX